MTYHTEKGIEINDQQLEALRRLFDGNPDGSKDFHDFCERAMPMLAGDTAIAIMYVGMYVGIEDDGYTHT